MPPKSARAKPGLRVVFKGGERGVLTKVSKKGDAEAVITKTSRGSPHRPGSTVTIPRKR